MKIIDFDLGCILSDSDAFFILFMAFLIVYVLIYLVIFFKTEVKYENIIYSHYPQIKKENRTIIFVAIFTILLCLFLQLGTICNSKSALIVKYINENINKTEINISKEQIINDILNGKITENKNNLPVYSQKIPITEEEYNELSKYKEEYDKRIENGNVNIIN